TKKALDEFKKLLEKYPESEYATDARNKYRAATDQLAGKEMEIGRYYLERNDNLAAVNRFRRVVEEYQQTRHIEEALFRLTESYYAMGLTQEAQTAAAVLGHNFPDSKWYRDAYALLEQGGFSPDEANKSWISKAFSRFKVL
ncbi:MAG: outer membrane protein assembly factor BamD, partial [Pseudomonadota bacterium]